MSVKVMVSLISSLLAASFVLAYGVTAIDELETNGGLPVQPTAFAVGARSFLYFAMAFISALALIGVRRLVKNR